MDHLLQVWRNIRAEMQRLVSYELYGADDEHYETLVRALDARLTVGAIECTLKHDFLKATHALQLK